MGFRLVLRFEEVVQRILERLRKRGRERLQETLYIIGAER